jgi:DNA-directed RNA polymerase specialized sigma24 family protein
VRNAGAAADVFQEVWSRLIATRGRYEVRAKFATYLIHIAHNCMVDFFRRDLRLPQEQREAFLLHEESSIVGGAGARHRVRAAKTQARRRAGAISANILRLCVGSQS